MRCGGCGVCSTERVAGQGPRPQVQEGGRGRGSRSRPPGPPGGVCVHGVLQPCGIRQAKPGGNARPHTHAQRKPQTPFRRRAPPPHTHTRRRLPRNTPTHPRTHNQLHPRPKRASPRPHRRRKARQRVARCRPTWTGGGGGAPPGPQRRRRHRRLQHRPPSGCREPRRRRGPLGAAALRGPLRRRRCRLRGGLRARRQSRMIGSPRRLVG